MENIPDTPEGIILESLLEGMSEYYSRELAQKVARGMRETRLKGYFQGGTLLFGYKIDGRKIVTDDINAATVKFIYDEFSKGVCVREIVAHLTAKGIKRKGKPFAMNTVYNILRNEKYTGIYRHGEEIVENMYPPIISKEIFKGIQAKLQTYRHGKNSIKVTYLLRNKLRCGYCGQSIIGESGTSKTGKKKYYYKCRGRKTKLNDCEKSAIPKDVLENLIIETTVKAMSEPLVMETVINGLLALQERQMKTNPSLNLYLKEQRQIETAIENIMVAIEKGVVTKSTAKRLKDYEARQEELERLILIEQSKQTIKLTAADIRKYYEQILKAEPQMLISYFVKEIIMYDDRIEIHYNSPLKTTPTNDESSDENRGFSFYTKSVRLNGNIIIITLYIT